MIKKRSLKQEEKNQEKIWWRVVKKGGRAYSGIKECSKYRFESKAKRCKSREEKEKPRSKMGKKGNKTENLEKHGRKKWEN